MPTVKFKVYAKVLTWGTVQSIDTRHSGVTENNCETPDASLSTQVWRENVRFIKNSVETNKNCISVVNLTHFKILYHIKSVQIFCFVCTKFTERHQKTYFDIHKNFPSICRCLLSNRRDRSSSVGTGPVHICHTSY